MIKYSLRAVQTVACFIRGMRKVRASQGSMSDNVRWRQLQGQCNRNKPPVGARAARTLGAPAERKFRGEEEAPRSTVDALLAARQQKRSAFGAPAERKFRGEEEAPRSAVDALLAARQQKRSARRRE